MSSYGNAWCEPCPAGKTTSEEGQTSGDACGKLQKPFQSNAIGREPIWHGSDGMGPGFEPYECLLAGMWKRTTGLPHWPPRGQQVLHQR